MTKHLGTFEVDVVFNAMILAFDHYELGTGLGGRGLSEAMDLSFGDLGGGVIDIAEISWFLPDNENPGQTFYADQADSFMLATLWFKGIAVGADSISVDGDDPFMFFGDEGGYPLQVASLSGARVNVEAGTVPVPEPGTFFLLGIGLAGILGAWQSWARP